ncbi:hypothetical protein HOU41_gp104 [Proteus phage Stubb]|uniref:Uncharacterized protein n=1 Tax=Proteus phage Stubb TaxID=2315597 RepID=A0A3B8DJA8_9CAUD|nr:hypothetical protein HOU41_gp104 [Proteus phage Stubb]AYJ73240.1 hypothetical protein CPT_Stubb_124 [Proteus phage Stubb]
MRCDPACGTYGIRCLNQRCMPYCLEPEKSRILNLVTTALNASSEERGPEPRMP